VGAARSVGAYAATEFDLPPAKVLPEFLEFFVGGVAVLLDGSFGAAPGHKLLVVFNDLSGVGRRVATGGVQVVVTGELGSDVYRQSIADRVSEKDTSEVMRTER
jgi:hypothetical protein